MVPGVVIDCLQGARLAAAISKALHLRGRGFASYVGALALCVSAFSHPSSLDVPVFDVVGGTALGPVANPRTHSIPVWAVGANQVQNLLLH